MSYEILAIPTFRKQLKKLSKKYPSLKSDFAKFLESLEKNPALGTSLGNNCFKIRISITSKSRGKSGGGRVITYLQVSDERVYLLTIYDKSNRESISNSELKGLIGQIPK